MKLFECQACGQPLYFENFSCVRCGHLLGFLPDTQRLSALEPEGEFWRPLLEPERLYKKCGNAVYEACNWLIPAESDEYFCAACRHNRFIPDLSVGQNRLHWQKLELAKHYLIYSLMRLGLPLVDRRADPEHGLGFDFLAEIDRGDGEVQKVIIGHADGVITLNIAEAEDAYRERMRSEMGETYRTLLGHFRHEVGHYYWDVLVRDAGKVEAFRAVFGDERIDYAAALAAHYGKLETTEWRESFISFYASSHPWEDFAETWAHYLHIVDTLDTAASFGVHTSPGVGKLSGLEAEVDFDAYRTHNFHALIGAWLPLTYAVNSLNRSMGQPDLYPFVLNAAVERKLDFVHGLVRGRRAAG